jgi:hypothetical protein
MKGAGWRKLGRDFWGNGQNPAPVLHKLRFQEWAMKITKSVLCVLSFCHTHHCQVHPTFWTWMTYPSCWPYPSCTHRLSSHVSLKPFVVPSQDLSLLFLIPLSLLW